MRSPTKRLQDIKILFDCNMWIEWLFIVVVLIWLYTLRLEKAIFIRKVKPKQEKRLEKLYDKFKNRFSNSNQGALPSTVDRVYCICSDEREDYIENQFSRFNMNVTYFKGIFPDDLTLNDYKTLSCTNHKFCKIHKKNTKLPVQLSFTMCMMDAMKKGYKTIIIFEDDIVINVDKDTLDESLKEFQKSQYEMFYMGYCHMNCNQKFDNTQHEYLVDVPDKKLVCHHAIAMKTPNFKYLLEYMFPMMNTKDRSFTYYFKKFNKKICVPKFSYFDQDKETHTTMNDNHEKIHETCDLT